MTLKSLALLILAGIIAVPFQTDAEVLAGWDVKASSGYGASPLPPSVQSAQVAVVGLTRGAGVLTSGTAAARAWGGVDWSSSTAAAAITANDVATFSITPNAGQTVSFSSVSRFDYRRSGTGPDTGVLQASVGGGSFFKVADLAYPISASSGASLAAIDLSGFPNLQAVPGGTTVAFRIVNFRVATGGTGSGTWYVFDFANNTASDLEIQGTVLSEAVPGITITQSGGSTAVAEGGATDSYTISLATTPGSVVNIGLLADAQVELSTDGIVYSPSLNLSFSSTSPQTVQVRAVDDAVVEASPHFGAINHTVSSLDLAYHGLTVAPVSVSITDNDVGPGPLRIHDIQGAAHLSPKAGTAVVRVPGIVTAVRSNGFYFQDPNPDADPATSEGLFVFTSSAPAVSVGNSVLVSGNVSEFRPGGDTDNLTITELVSPVVLVVSAGNALPAPIVIGAGGRIPPAAIFADDAVGGNVENAGTPFDPENDGIDFYESLEGMRVQLNNPVASGPLNQFGELPVLVDNGAGATSVSASGGSILSPGDFNPERILIDNELGGVTPAANVGARLGTVVGVIDYSFANFKLYFTEPVALLENSLAREVGAFSGDLSHLSVATFNVENLDPADGAAKFDSLAWHIVNSLHSPDVVNLEEVQDNNGAVNDSVVDASLTLQNLINAITAAGGPSYQFRQINPVDDQDGGEPGGNIRVAFLFNPARVQFVDRPGGGPTTATSVLNVGGLPRLSASPGRLSPTSPAFNSSRKPLAGEFVFNGETVFIIGNHFNSKGGDEPLFGRFQPPVLSSEVQRLQQAQIVHDFVADILAIDSGAHLIVLGDLNDFQFSNPVNLLKTTGLVDLIELLPANERYTYVYEGNSQVLDHILAMNLESEVDVVHINSEFADQVSDHDPVLARFALDGIPPVAGVSCTRTAAGFILSLSASDNVTASPAIYVKDSVSGFRAGPFTSGDRVFLRIVPNQEPSSKPQAGYAARLQFKGSAKISAVDAFQNESALVTCP